jgi:serine/threonine protein kinase
MPYTSKCDIWAVGVIFFEMLHRRTPWNAKSVYELVKKIESIPFKMDEKLSPIAKDFIQRSLGSEEGIRYSW